MEMFNPPHPGEILREECLKPLRLTVTAAAKGLGVSRGPLSELLNGHNGISAEMAIRLEKAGWGSAESWLRKPIVIRSLAGAAARQHDQSEALSRA
jgi:antitoxin HigA-1